jgi:hypothetical protein
MLITAVDPIQENKLLGLDSAVSKGSPLDEHAAAQPYPSICCGATLPVLVSTRSYQREPLSFTVERVEPPARVRLSQLLKDQHLNTPPGVIPTYQQPRAPAGPAVAGRRLAGGSPLLPLAPGLGLV